MNNTFPYIKFLLVTCSVLLLSCDKDFNVIGSEVIGGENFLFSKDNSAEVKCYNQFDNAVQTNNLAINQLGILSNAGFGTTTASFVTQLELASAYINPTIGTDIEIVSVELAIPYFSTLTGTDSDGNNTYVLDSIYGKKSTLDVVDGKIKLHLFESKKFLNTYNEFLDFKRYYSSEGSVFESNIDTILLNNDVDAAQNEQFTFSPLYQTELTYNEAEVKDAAGIITTAAGSVSVTTNVAPRMKLSLNKAYFLNKLFGTDATGKLANNATFKNYFRGIYFKVENVGNDEALALLNFSAGTITVHYTEKIAPAAPERIYKKMVLNLKGNVVNLLNNTYTGASLPTSSTPQLTTTNLYLKGGAGFHSYIDLFGGAGTDGIVPLNSPDLLDYKNKNWIINEANLIFTENSSARTAINVNPILDSPTRIYLYDAVNKRPLLDYYADNIPNTSKPKYSKVIHGGIKYTENGLTKYKIKITNHIKNILEKDSTNVRLGLVVTEDINNVTNMYIKDVASDKYYNRLPYSSVINPLSTILYGSDNSIPDSNRVKLEIFYTKPN